MTTTEELDPLQIVRDRFEQSASLVAGLKAGLIDFFKAPKRTISVCFPVEMDDGSVRTFHGYRMPPFTGPNAKVGNESVATSFAWSSATWPEIERLCPVT